MNASVCICTHNGARRLGDVLGALALQDVAAEQWEVIVVDNASTDDTPQVAKELLEKHFGPRGRLVSEPQPGLSFARRRASLESKGEIVCFLDDDNLAAPDFVRQAIQIFKEDPRVGSIGGKVLPEWEAPPTPLAQAVASFALAIWNFGDTPFTYDWIGLGPVGAGLCVRSHLLRDFCSDPAFCAAVTDRKGNSLISGGDLAIGVKVMQAGYTRRYEPRLCLHHQLPASRMRKDYLRRLYEGTGRGQAAVRRLFARGGNLRVVGLLVAVKDFFLWLRGALFGPNKWPPITPLRQEELQNRDLRRDLHDLEQSLLWGRASEALEFATRRPWG